ncbi:MAG: DinB family protein, partial [Isosphaeraceae bacterium]
TFTYVRAWNLILIRSAPREAFSRTLSHPERGRMTFQVLVETMAGHDLNHLGQLDVIASTAA